MLQTVYHHNMLLDLPSGTTYLRDPELTIDDASVENISVCTVLKVTP